MYPLNHKQKSNHVCVSEQGYTLIQMAMALIVLGLLAGMFAQIYQLYSSTQKSIKTQENVSVAIQSIHTYRQSFGHYPCPAPMDAARTLIAAPPAPTYGRASDYARYLAAGTVPLNAGDCAEGICIEETNRGGAIGTLRVRVGAVPFRDMQIDEEKTFDGYGSRLWYAVTEDQCSLATFDDTKGGIKIVNDLGEDQTSPAGSASFIVISPGADKAGGYGKFGQLQIACPAAAVPESQNCRDVTVSPQTDITATYLSQFTTDATAATTYDDVVEYFSSSVNQLWRRTTTTSEDIVDVANSSVGIGESAPVGALDIAQTTVNTGTGQMATTQSTGAGLQNGALRVNTNIVPAAKLYATTYCAEGGLNCFQTSDIMGDQTAGTGGMKCPADTYPVGITSNGTNAEFTCVPDISIKCPAGYIFAGFTNSGGTLVPSCTNSNLFASCPAEVKQLCGDDINLPLTAHGGTTGIYSKGSCKQDRYACSNGTWNHVGGYPNGSCTNNVVTTTNNLACGNCWAGTYTSTTYECTSGTNTFATDCSCQASGTCYWDQTNWCPASAPSGTAGVTRFYKVCNPSNPQQPAYVDPTDPGTVITNPSCSCTKLSRNLFGYSATSGFIRTSTPALPVAGDTSTNVWPGDITRCVAQFQDVDASCNWFNSGAPIDACGCNTADKYSGVLVTTPSCKKPKVGSRVFGTNSYSWQYDVMKSINNNAAACTFDAPVLEDAAQFEDIQTYWREQPGGASDFNKPASATGTTVDDPCTCSANLNDVRKCKKGNGTGTYDIYDCKCTGS